MKLNDAVWGALLLILAAAVLINIQGFPRIPGQSIGPAAFPGLIAALLAGCAVLLVVRGIRQGPPWISFGAWLRSPTHVANFLLAIGAVVFYIVAADTIGFHLTGTVILVALYLKLGVRARTAFPVAIITVFVIHFIFYKMLRVTLPWGVMPIFY